jgi:4-hydroxybenzoate polyprenyltransferase
VNKLTGGETPGTIALNGSGRELAAVNAPGLGNRLSGLVALTRPIFFILTPLNAASAAVLALGGYPSLAQCLYGFFAVAFASCAVNVFNDYRDRERDRHIWPSRAIPSGRVRPNEALLVAGLSLVISLTIVWLAFNPLTSLILLLAMAFGILYSAYLRDRVGYLALPPIVGLIYLGGWAAFSPETLLTSWLPWYLFILGVAWQAAHIMIYYPLHIMPPDRSPNIKAPPALFFTPSPGAAVKLGVVLTCLTLLLGALLPLLAPLGALYLALVTAAGVYALISGLRLYKHEADRRRGLRAFTSLSILRLVISAAILITVLLA